MDEQRATVANLLRQEYISKSDPPSPNFWYDRRADNQIVIGVENAQQTLDDNIYPEEAVVRRFSIGNVVVLDRAQLLAFMRRSDGDFANWRVPKAGLMATVKRMVGR